jgi:glycosyltransferase involved in cell wall biosynthesis
VSSAGRVATPRVAVLANVAPHGEPGGAERFYFGLRDALRAWGADAEVVPVLSDERDFVAVQRSYLRFYDLDLSRYDGVISTKAPAYVVRHPRHVCYLQHTMRVFYDMFEREFPNPTPELLAQRSLVHRLDTAALGHPRLLGRLVIGEQVRKRLLESNGLDAEVLHQASALSGFRTGAFDYLFMPGRLHRWKRVDLVIRAMRHVQASVRLLIAGAGEDEAALRQLAGTDSRIVFLGRVSDEQLLELYANALAVPFVPVMEDFGLVTLEAFYSRKPVITCVDSGEPAAFVRDGESGYICPPDEQEIALRIETLTRERRLAKAMGERGLAAIAHISWDAIAERLLKALGLHERRSATIGATPQDSRRSGGWRISEA